MPQRDIELLKGTLEFLILQSLKDEEERHGFEVLRWIKEASDGALQIEEGALYPALHRLENKGWVASEWGLSERNRKAKYYRITKKGAKQMVREEASWKSYVDVVGRVMAVAEAESS